MCNKHDVLMIYTLYADQIMVIISHIKQLSFYFLLVKCLGSTFYTIHCYLSLLPNCAVNIRLTPQIHRNITEPFLLLLPHLL